MARISDLLAAGPTLSFEFGPPRTEEAAERLERVLHELEPLKPSFVSVTYGAGGSTRQATREIVERIHRDTSMTVMPHLTCVAQRRDEIDALVRAYRDEGIENLLALAGDPPADEPERASDFTYAHELIELARGIGTFCVGVAAYPEVHPRSPDRASDRRYLAAKLAMADFAITNFFFDADDYFELVEELAVLGVTKPVLPGLMLFTNADGVRRMAALNQARIPDALERELDAAAGDAGAVRRLAVRTTVDLARRLLDGGAPGLHLYTLNFSRATLEVVGELGL